MGGNKEMRNKRILALLLALLLSFSSVLTALAEEPQIMPENLEQFAETTEESKAEDENIQTAGDNLQEENLETLGVGVEGAIAPVGGEVNANWTVHDFAYTTMEQKLYGCDYTRQFIITGVAIAGLSDVGKEKIKTNKELVIPATDDAGNPLVGIADNAFENQGITSVVFPTGMHVEYDDTITHNITRRGNFIIGMNAFAKNELTNVHLPDGVIAVMSSAFRYNKLETVTFPRSIWWIETVSFANNQISKINFPKTCDFQLEIHGMAFADNQITSVRLPDYVEVVNKHTFILNPGMESVPNYAPEKEKSLGGVVYMYTDNANLEFIDRIHHIDRVTESQKAWHQKLVVTDIHEIEGDWSINDFTIEGTVITGLSESGITKRATNKHLVLPDRNLTGTFITALADTTNANGLFASATEGFETVELPSRLIKIGNRAFAVNGLKEVAFPSSLQEIGLAAFQQNKLVSVVLPDSVTLLGGGAFATNPTIERISISKGLTDIPAGAFGCSDATNWMEGLTTVTIPEGIITIRANAFAGNNFAKIKIPASVTAIGNYAFSTKNYLKTPCTVELPEGLLTIGNYAFRNKIIDTIELPTTVTGLPNRVFEKVYSDGTEGMVTKVIVRSSAQYNDKTKFPNAEHHKIYLVADNEWTAEDFTYSEFSTTLYPANDSSDKMTFTSWAVAGFSEQGAVKHAANKNLVIPAVDSNGKKVTGVANNAFRNMELESVIFPEDVKAPYSGLWNTSITQRGDFVIGNSAFANNNLKTLVLPEGIIAVNASAFTNNKLVMVKFPETLMLVASQAFANNEIITLDFPAETDFKLNIDNMAFAINKIAAVQLPDNTEKVAQYAFLQNTGKEPVVGGNVNEAKGGVVYMHTETNAILSESLVYHVDNAKSKVQKIVVATIAPVDAPWGVSDFTYDMAGTAITGLSAAGQAKIVVNSNIALPNQGPGGEDVVGIGAGTSGVGTFGYNDGIITHVPTSIVLPAKLETIGNMAFAASKFETIAWPMTIHTLGMAVFQGSGLKSVVIPDSITTMGQGMFSNSASLESMVWSNTLTEIPQSTFTMTAIQDVVIPEGVTTIGNTAFSGAHVKTVSLPSTLTSIGNTAFNNHQIEEVNIPATVTSIGTSAFAVVQTGLDYTLKKLTLHEGLISIGNNAFRNSALTEVELPSTVTTLNNNAFNGTSPKVKLRTATAEQLVATASFVPNGTGHEVVFDMLSGSGWSYDDFTFSGDAITGWSIQGQAKRLTNKNLVLPDTAPDGTVIKKIAEEAFKIPNDEVTQLADRVDSPNGMESVRLPKDLEVIEKQAFEYNNLIEITFGNTMTEIGECAFKGNRLEEVILPDSITTLGSGAFTMNNITSITLSRGLTKIPQAAFSMNIRLSQIDIPNTITVIGEMAFAGARLGELTIPESVVKIERKAFHLHRLSELTIPSNVKEIGESAFEGTYKGQTLTSLILEEGVEKIGKNAFKEGLLQEVNLPFSLQEFGETPFLNNAGFGGSQEVTCSTDNPQHLLFNDSTSHEIDYQGTWGPAFFTYDKAGTEVTGLSAVGQVYVIKNKVVMILGADGNLDENIISIGDEAFKGYGITGVVLPKNLTTIGNEAFANNSLGQVNIPETVTDIAQDAFVGNPGTVELLVMTQMLADKYPTDSLAGAKITYSGAGSGNTGGGDGGSGNTGSGDGGSGSTGGNNSGNANTNGKAVATGDVNLIGYYIAIAIAALAVHVIVKKKVKR